ncbi:MAG: TraB/GumN family protein [Myxococcota bacterium]
MPPPARTRRWVIEASEHVAVLRDGAKTYWIIGTAHVSSDSVREVREVIETVRPDTVCVELCKTRYESLTDESRWKKLDIFQVLRQGKGLLLLANLAMGAYQRKLGAELGVEPGAELLEGARAAADVGAELRLVDREIQVTLRRTWANVGFLKKAELVGAILTATVSNEKIDSTAIEDLKARAQLSEMLEEFARILPEVKAPLIDERDRYMISGVEEAPGERVVAVVGAAHVPGMREAFGSTVDRAALDELPAPSRWGKVLKWLIPGLVLAAFAVGASRQGGQTLEAMLYAWILPNSIACAVLTALAGGKPLSIITGFIASPITSLNPMLGAGMVVGLVEAWSRRPTVQDAENINRDVQSLRGFYRNPFTRVLLVVFASTLGSALGAWVGATWVITLLR